jgi:glycosyltransferase involved in cell wall biosynthesis
MDPHTRVAITLEQFWHRVPGGTATAIWAMARALAERDLDLVGVSAWNKTRLDVRFRLPFAIEWLPLPRVALYAAWHRLRRPKVELATGPVEVIHATTSAIPPKSAPLVVTVHDLAFLHSPEHYTARGRRLFERGLELTITDADIVVCPSQATADDCLAHGFDAGRIRVVPWGVEPVAVSDDDVADALAAFEVTRPYVLWTGTIEPRKNLVRLVEAFLSMDTDAELVLAGPQGWNEDLSRLLARGAGRIRALGYVETHELAALYAGASVFCYPSLLEGFGLPVLEAMAQGTPVVTARGSATEEAAGGAGVLVDPLDVASIAEGIASLLTDPSRAELIGAAGRARAAEMTWAACAEQMHAVYDEARRS